MKKRGKTEILTQLNIVYAVPYLYSYTRILSLTHTLIKNEGNENKNPHVHTYIHANDIEIIVATTTTKKKYN